MGNAIDRRERIEDLETTLIAVLEGERATLWTALPGIVNTYDASKQTCTIKAAPQCLRRNKDGTDTLVNIPLLVDCPVVFPGGGGFTLTFPIAAGDEALVIFASRCIDSWWDTSAIAPQSEFRMHDLSDGFVLVGPRSRPKALSAASTSCVELRSDDHATYVQLDAAGNINMKAISVNVIGNLTVTGTATATDFATPTLPSYVLHYHNITSGGLPGFSAPPQPGS